MARRRRQQIVPGEDEGGVKKVLDQRKLEALPEEEGPEYKRGPVAILRKGYTLQIGNQVLFGRRRVTIDPVTARLHLHKFENVGEIKEWLGMPRQAPRPSIKENAERVRDARTRQQAAIVAEAVAQVLDQRGSGKAKPKDARG